MKYLLILLLISCNHLTKGVIVNKTYTSEFWMTNTIYVDNTPIINQIYYPPTYTFTIGGYYQGRYIIENNCMPIDIYNRYNIGDTINLK